MRALLLVLCFILLIPAHANSPVRVLQLLARSREIVADPGLSINEWRWVRERQKIRLAVWQPMSPPYDITTGLNDYGGINADFIGLIAENLNIQTEILLYNSYTDAQNALKEGQADLIAQAADNQQQAGFILSKPYSENIPAEVINSDDRREAAAVRTIAISPVYDRNSVMVRYPGAKVVEFSTNRHAVEALAFGNIDLFFCDATTAQYLISQSSLSNLSVRPLRQFKTQGFSFAGQENQQWIGIINKVLKALPDNAWVDIHRRWNGGIPLSLSEQRPIYTSLEQKWIDEHPRIRVAVPEENTPLNYFESSGKMRGVIADILTALQLRTQFTFVIQKYPNIKEALKSVQNGNSDLIAGTTQESIWNHNLLTTRTWLYNSWVMVGKAKHTPGMQMQRIAVLEGEAPESWLQQHAKSSVSEPTKTWKEGLDRVMLGRSDMMIMPLVIAKSHLSQSDRESLKILASLDTEPMRFTFGASRRAYPLIAVLNKALINIHPEDLHSITRNRYGSNAFDSDDESQKGGVRIIWVVLLVTCSVLFIMAAVFYQRRRLNRRLQRIIDAIPAPLYLCDRNARLMMANKALCQIPGVSGHQITGKTLSDFFPELSHTESERTEVTINQRRRTLRLWRSPIVGESRAIGGWIDNTRHSLIMQALRRAKRDAIKASRVKSAFLAAMSHEIRTPLSAIIGMLELVMQRKDSPQKNHEAVRIAWEAAQSLLALIGNILDVSRIESGRLVLRPERTALGGLIESIAALLEGLAVQKGLQFKLAIDGSLNGEVMIDAVRFKQIVVNLVGNAIKFTPSGEVTLSAEPEWEDSTHIMLRLRVEDTGLGIDEQTQQRLFQPFEQGENSQMAQGSGLGLYISRTLAQMMGGGITLISKPGEGTCVTVSLKLPKMIALPASAEEKNEPDATLPERVLHILIVDDNPVGRLLLEQQIAWLGHQVTGCDCGEKALALILNSNIDVVFTDCNMPMMDGYTLARELRRIKPDLRIIGVTADARHSAADAALQAGMDLCLFKPVTLAMLQTNLPQARAAEVSQDKNDESGMVSFASLLAYLPPELIQGENGMTFLALQIEVIDETLANIAKWFANPNVPLREILHRLRGGIQLLDARELEANCLKQEKNPEREGVVELVDEIKALRSALIALQNDGLQNLPPVLQEVEEG